MTKESSVAMKTRSVRFNAESIKELEKVSKEKGVSASVLMRIALDVYIQRERLADDLSEMESRLSVSITRSQKEVERVKDDIQLVVAIVDQLIKFQLYATPDVLDADFANAVGSRRYDGFLVELRNSFDVVKKRSSLANVVDAQRASVDGNSV